MNSALFVLYMNPILRQIIYDLPLCDEFDIKTPSKFVSNRVMFDILISLQKLFGSLQLLDISALSTKELTEAFGWNNADTSDHHDSGEFIRQFFECLDDVLQSTAFSGVINNLYRVVNVNYLQCTNCKLTKNFQEICLDINVSLQGNDGLNTALENLYNNYDIINDYHCSSCDKRVDLKKSNKICQLPDFLTFFLNRLGYDLYNGDRIKIGSKFEFPLEIDMSKYLADDLLQSEVKSNSTEDNLYELYAVIIHNGNPHRGHYFSYIRDFNHEGKWNLGELKQFQDEPERFDKKIVEEIKEKDKSTGGKQPKEKNNNRSKEKNVSKSAQSKLTHSKADKEDNRKLLSLNIIFLNNLDKSINFDECDHPIKYQNKKLSERWFEFNDSIIHPIRVGKLQKQFQSSESAYSLFYMKKNLNVTKCEVPGYLKECKKINFLILIKRFPKFKSFSRKQKKRIRRRTAISICHNIQLSRKLLHR